MKQLFLMVDNGAVELVETPCPGVKENTVVVETLYSAVSAGTERGLSSFGGKNLFQKMLERPDQVQKVLDKMATDGVLTAVEAAFNKLHEPMPMGYSGVGKVVLCGRNVTKVQAGDRVAMAGQAYHSEVNRVNQNLIAKIPDQISDLKEYAFCALGGIALEGIHQAKVMPGETVAVIGMGLLGNILSRILCAYGCDVIGYDIADKTMEKTKLKAFIRSDDENAVEKTKALTRGRGVDKVIITASTDSNAPIDLSAAIARDRAIICMIGVTQMNLDRRPYYEKELTFTMARSYGPGRYDDNYEQKGIDYPIGFVRFTEGRNLEEFVRLLSNGLIELTDLITHVYPFNDAAKAYDLITNNPNKERYIGVLLEYKEDEGKWTSRINFVPKPTVKDGDKIGIGMIGAGNFAKTTIIPIMKETEKYNFMGLATTGGVNAAQAEKLADFNYVTNDYHDLLKDDSIDLIIVSTRHDSHAKFVCEALEAGKSVYCEKPLCLTIEELDRIEEKYKDSRGELFCGLNRRHSSLIEKAKKELRTDQIPAIYEYTVNAGFIPGSHWTQEESIGGGRIIGEACHFVDTIQYLDGSRLLSVQANFLRSGGYDKKDNCALVLAFESGAVGTVLYTSMGSKKYAKEQLKIFTGGSVAVVDNYLKYSRYGNGRRTEAKLRQDKGIRDEYLYMCDVLEGKKPNDAIQDALLAMRLLIDACTGGESGSQGEV